MKDFNYVYSRNLTKNKSLEIQLTKWKPADNFFKLITLWSRKGDHNGFNFDLDVWTISFSFKIYDNRHWDWEKDDYENHH